MRRLLLCFPILGLLLLLPFTFTTAQESTATPAPSPTPTATPIPRPQPTVSQTIDRATVELYFSNIPQGSVGLIHIYGSGMQGAKARFLDGLTDFYQAYDGYYGFISVSMEQTAKKYPLSLFTWYDDGTRQTIDAEVEVVIGKFVKQEVTVPPEKAYLVDPEIERAELARMESIFAPFTLVKGWDTFGFELPIPGAKLTSAYGAFRTFNAIMNSRHTGWDLKATLGLPILASAGGTVVFADLLDIRGNNVVIDHGYGVYSTYSHLSQFNVTVGQVVNKGQVLGLVGNTGRTSAAHFHWEMAVNGVFVDAVQFITLWKP